MGATSVTGTSGPGAVSGSQKGSEHMSLSVKKLIGPHIVAAGTETLSGTTGVVELPAVATSLTGYFVMLQSSTSTAAYVSSALAETDSDDWTFTITGSSGATVNWIVVKPGL